MLMLVFLMYRVGSQISTNVSSTQLSKANSWRETVGGGSRLTRMLS